MRCWDRAALDLPPGLILLTGPNGAGKTSLVEAVVLGCLGVSPRAPVPDAPGAVGVRR